MVGIRYRDDPNAARPEHPIHFPRRLERGRRVLEHLDHEDAVERRVGKRQALGDVVDEHIGTRELGCDVQPLIRDPRRQELADVAFAPANVEDGVPGLRLRELLGEPIADAFLTPVPPSGAVAIERGQLGRARGDAFRHS